MDLSIFVFILVGFVAQLIDGALGMAYGVSSNAFLLSLGIPPKYASASVHAAEVVTTGVSGLAHWRFGNIHFDLARRLVIPGVIGAAIGAYLLTQVNGDVIKPYIAIYLAIMGIVIIWKAFREVALRHVRSWLLPLGLAGGFMDAIGGGGWGPIVTTTLVARGNRAALHRRLGQSDRILRHALPVDHIHTHAALGNAGLREDHPGSADRRRTGGAACRLRR